MAHGRRENLPQLPRRHETRKQNARFLSFECPKCAFVLIEVAKEDAPPTFMRRFGGETFDPKQQGKRAQPGEVE